MWSCRSPHVALRATGRNQRNPNSVCLTETTRWRDGKDAPIPDIPDTVNFFPPHKRPASRRLRTLVQFSAPHQASGDVGRLKRRALGRRMGGEISGDRDENVPALVSVPPYRKLSNSRLQH